MHMIFIIWMLSVGNLWAQEQNSWFDLQQARLLLVSGGVDNLQQSVDILNRLIAVTENDDPIMPEILYWKGRALYQQGYVEHSREKLIESSNNYDLRNYSLYFLQQSAGWERRILSLPYTGNPWVNMDGKITNDESLLWLCSLDANITGFSKLSMDISASELPLYITVELIDWRNERWVWRDVVPDLSQPLTIRLGEFRAPREENKFMYRNILISAESEDGRRVPIVVSTTTIL